MLFRIGFILVVAAFLLGPKPVIGAESYDNCVGFIDSAPATISTQGTWCLRRDLSTSIATGNAITVAVNNVTIDCNDFKLGGLAAGTGTQAMGIVAGTGRLNVVVRNCNVRGFLTGIAMQGYEGGGNFTVENNRVDGSTSTGIQVVGDGSVLRGNAIRDTGGTTLYADEPHAIRTFGAVDVTDNVVSGVHGTVGAYGIKTAGNEGGSVSGNRVRGVSVDGTGMAQGINVYSSGRVSIRDNVIMGVDDTGGGEIGLGCTWEEGRARDNMISGFDVGLSGCGDAGGNDIVP